MIKHGSIRNFWIIIFGHLKLGIKKIKLFYFHFMKMVKIAKSWESLITMTENEENLENPIFPICKDRSKLEFNFQNIANFIK